jgi:hypothetical protein
MSRYQPFASGRRITRAARQRASTLTDQEIAQYLEVLTIQFGMALDQWRYKSGPASEVAMQLDSIMALWNEIELRGLE